MSTAASTIRHKLYDYIRVADNKKLYAIYNLLENEIEETREWWKNKQFITELDRRYQALERGSDKGYTIEQLEASIGKLQCDKIHLLAAQKTTSVKKYPSPKAKNTPINSLINGQKESKHPRAAKRNCNLRFDA